MSSPDRQEETRTELNTTIGRNVPLWDAVHEYVRSCGGNPEKHVYGNVPRMMAVEKIEGFVAAYGHDVFDRQRVKIADLESRVLQRIVARVRSPRYCVDCNKQITAHAAQTADGNWHHLGCITIAPSKHYLHDQDRVNECQWYCVCGHHNPPGTQFCSKCGLRQVVRCDRCGSKRGEGRAYKDVVKCHCGGVFK